MTTLTDISAWNTLPGSLDASSDQPMGLSVDGIAPDTPLEFPAFLDADWSYELPPALAESAVAADHRPTAETLPQGEGSAAEFSAYRPLITAAIPEVVELWGCPFSRLSMGQTLDHIDRIVADRRPTALITANLNYLMLLDRSPRLQAFTRRAALVLCDGMPILWRSRLGQRPLPERVAGADLIYRLAERSAQRGWRIYLLGGAPEVTGEAGQRLTQQYPGLTICGIDSPPYGEWTTEQRRAIRERIIDASPDILLVAFGQPKGELWIDDNLDSLGVPLTMQIGASFDFVVGAARRAPHWLQKIGGEWFYRLLSEPRRLAPRYIANAWHLAKLIRRELLHALS